MGVHVNFAPDVDVNNNPDNPVINDRSFGEDKNKVALFGSDFLSTAVRRKYKKALVRHGKSFKRIEALEVKK